MMRPALRLGGVALLIGIGPLTAADDRPLPLDRAKVERRSQEWLAWNRRSTVGEYDRAGRKDPRWDASVRTVLELTARRMTLQDPLPQDEELNQAARRALDAGSADPLVLYIYSQTSTKPNCFPGDDEFLRRSQRAADALRVSDYSPMRRTMGEYRWITYQFASDKLDEAAKSKLSQDLDALVGLIGPSAKSDSRGEFWEAWWYGTLWDIYLAQRWLNGDRSQTAFERVDALLGKISGVEALRLTFRGKFYAEFAWEARGDRTAVATSEKQFAGFGGRLIESRRALEAAYRLNPE